MIFLDKQYFEICFRYGECIPCLIYELIASKETEKMLYGVPVDICDGKTYGKFALRKSDINKLKECFLSNKFFYKVVVSAVSPKIAVKSATGILSHHVAKYAANLVLEHEKCVVVQQ